MQQERDSLVLISSSVEVRARIKQASEFLLLEPRFFMSLEEFSEQDQVRPRTLLVDLEMAGEAQNSFLEKIERLLPKTWIVGIGEGSSNLKFSMNLEQFKSFALEFFLFQRCYCEFYEIEPTDLFPDTLVYFNAYHFLPLNKRYLPLVHENFTLSERKHKRVEILKALYISQMDTYAYAQYIEKYFDQFKVGLKKRFKARTYQVLSMWRESLGSTLFEHSAVKPHTEKSPDLGLWIRDLLNYLTGADDPWVLLYDMVRLPCFNFDRSLMEVIAGCYLSKSLGEDQIDKIIDLKYLLTLARLQTESLLHKRWMLDQTFTADEKNQWDQYPALLSHQTFEESYPADARKRVEQYQSQFLKKTEPASTSLLNYAYLGEICVTLMQRASSDVYKKEDILEGIIVKCKSDGILAEAWIEELRQFLKK